MSNRCKFCNDLYVFYFVLASRCNDQYVCEVPVLNRLFGDPCPAMYKYLEVYYACANSKYLYAYIM